MSLAIHSRLGPYEILEAIGAGGMGEVYRARDTRLERDVAIKVGNKQIAQDPQSLSRFYREVRAVAALAHPNILTIFDIGVDQDLTYAVMELLKGETLGSRLRHGPLEWSQTIRIATMIADGLAAAHAQNIIHRDIKPDNIFLTADGGVKILDFGLARLQMQNPSGSAVLETLPGTVLGTVAYMAPEQVRGFPADERSDVFSFGCVVYEMIIGKRPFPGQTTADTMAAILHDAPLSLTQSGRVRPSELDRLILRCLSKEPMQRFQKVREIADTLRNLGQAAVKTRNTQQVLETVMLPQTGPETSTRTQSLAVLPFRNMSSDAENEFFSEGLAEELINVLSRIEDLRVASRTSSFAFRGKDEDVRRIGEQLNVRTVLEGSVRKAGNRLRISVQLVNVADGFQLWSETYNRELEDVFAIQDEIAQNIAQALQVLLTEKEKRAIERVQTSNVEAYEYYLRGRQYFHQFRRKGYELALQMFSKAIDIDPSYALAFTGIADCHSLLYMYFDSRPANLDKAVEASRKALELNPQLAEAHVARGLAESLKKNFSQAEMEFQEAIRLNPTLFEARYFYGRTCRSQGKHLESAQRFEEACQLRPDDYQAATHLPGAYLALGREADARAATQRGLDVVTRHLEVNPDDARALYLGAVSCCQMGLSEQGLEWAGRALALEPEDPVTLYNVACVNAVQGRVEPALDCLESALKHGFAHKEWIQHDSDLQSLHGHARFNAILGKL